jgi:non-heme chloroperoxidase
MHSGTYLRVSPDLEFYFEEAGNGSPIIFIPGWAGTTEFYTHQLAHFAKHYRAITFDPRSQGRSSKTLENNHYTQHGSDLKAFIDSLNLTDVILVAFSWGCLDVYAYLRAFGINNLKACVFIDEMPKSLATAPDDWAEFASYAEAIDFIQAIVHDFRGLLTQFLPPMMKRKMLEEELAWAIDQLVKMPTSAAALLAIDGAFANYTQEAQMIDGNIPVLNVVSEDQGERARVWLQKHAPHADIVVMGKHLMLLEFPDQFNRALETFLKKA